MFVSLTFPETRDVDIMETTEEAEFFYEHKVAMKTKPERSNKKHLNKNHIRDLNSIYIS